MEELKLLLEMGPNVSEKAVEAFIYYAIMSTVRGVLFVGLGIIATVLFYKGFIYAEDRKLDTTKAYARS